MLVSPVLAAVALLRGPPAPPRSAARAALRPTFTADDFIEWAVESGIEAPKLSLLLTQMSDGEDELDGAVFDEVRGAVVTEDVEPGEVLCTVPRTCCLDLSAVNGSPCPELAPLAVWEQLAWYERLAVWLLAESRRGGASEVSGYVAYLPRPETFSDWPLAWSDEELEDLRYPPLAASLREQAANLDELHALLAAASAAPPTKAELRWAQQLVLSRAFASTIANRNRQAPPPPKAKAKAAAAAAAAPGAGMGMPAWMPKLPSMPSLPGLELPAAPEAIGRLFSSDDAPERQPAQMEMAMMPMLDAMNHASNAQVQCSFDATSNSFVLTADEPLEAGEQAFLSYGEKSNDELLQLFGFVEVGNPHDTFFSIGLDAHAAAIASSQFFDETEVRRRLSLVSQLGLDEALGFGELRADGAPQETLHALRLLFGSVQELEGDLRKLARPASLATEERVWTSLRSYCKAARSTMGGSRNADVAEARTTRCPRRRLVLQFRAEKKRLLSELEKRLQALPARSRRAGRVLA